MVRLGADTDPTWNMTTAYAYVDQSGIALRERVSDLPGGQQTQVARTMRLAEQPSFLILDEPMTELDPVAREDLVRLLVHGVAGRGTNVVLSIRALSGVTSTCDYLVIVPHSTIVPADDLEFVVESHRFLNATPPSANSGPNGAR
jgi:ABC-2 type transport system ATP-binding protein